MRDYRGKRKDGKGWVYGWYFEDKNCGGIVGKTCGFIIPHGAMVDDIDKALYGFVEVIPETVGQDTGEKDNDNMKIYEGNILEYIGSRCLECGQFYKYPGHKLYTIIYDKAEFKCLSNDGNYMLPDIWEECLKVIGNITDNPELLETEK